MQRVIDLRSASELDVEERARHPIDEPDESTAHHLVGLLRQSDREYDTDREAYDRTAADIKAIGEQLCRDGGDPRMRLVAYRMAALGGRIRTLEMHWDGVCGWMA